MSRCWIRESGLVDSPCHYRADGQPDPAHLLPKSWLTKSPTGPNLSPEEAQDERLIVPICRRHHSDLDEGRVRLLRAQLPGSLEEWAQGKGKKVQMELARRYGEKDVCPVCKQRQVVVGYDQHHRTELIRCGCVTKSEPNPG